MKRAAILMVVMLTMALFTGCGVSEEQYRLCTEERDNLAAEKEKLTTEIGEKDVQFVESLQKLVDYAAEAENQRNAAVEETGKLSQQLAEANEKQARTEQKAKEALAELLKAQVQARKLQQQVEDSKQAMAKTGEMMAQLQQALDAANAELKTLKAKTPATVE